MNSFCGDMLFAFHYLGIRLIGLKFGVNLVGPLSQDVDPCLISLDKFTVIISWQGGSYCATSCGLSSLRHCSPRHPWLKLSKLLTLLIYISIILCGSFRTRFMHYII